MDKQTLSPADTRHLRSVAKKHKAAGLSASESMRRAVDSMIEETRLTMEDIGRQTNRKPERNIDFTLRHESAD
jgi:hypothetical protein